MKAIAQLGEEDPRVFADDCIEFYFAPRQNEVPNVQIGVNSINAHCDILHTKDRADFKWNGTARSATGRTGGGWVVELAFPNSDISSAPPTVGDIWGFRAGRNHAGAGGLLSAVNYASTGFQNPVEFARLIMGGDLPRLDMLAEENRLNHDYINRLRNQAKTFINESARQLAFATDIPAPIKAKRGLTPLEEEVRSVVMEAQAQVTATGHQAVARWNRLSLALKTTGEKLDRFGYLVASVGGMQAALPPAFLTCIRLMGGVWYLASKEMVAAVEPKHGMIAGIWDRKTGQRFVVSGYLLYELQTKAEEKRVDERADRVTRAVAEGERLVFECTNAEMPGVRLQKQYSLAKVSNEPRILCRRLQISGQVKEMTLLQVTSRTLFDDDYRKPSFYNRIFVIGTMGDGRSCAPAAEIIQPSIQRAWFHSTEGRAQFSLVNPQTETGIAEYLYKENDRWTFPQALAQSYWTPFGWDMGSCQTFLARATLTPSLSLERRRSRSEGRTYSAETRYHLFRGDRLAFHREYLSLPEYAAVRRDGTPSPLAQRLAAAMGVNVYQCLADNPAVRKYLQATAGSMEELLRPDEWGLAAWAPYDTRWPDLPNGDQAELVHTHNNKSGVILNRYSAAQVRDAIRRVKEVNPRVVTNTYTFITDLHKESQALKEHPEWVVKNRDGTSLEGFFGTEYLRANWCPEFVKQLTDRLLATCDYFGLDACYLDFSVGVLLANWGRGKVIGFDTYLSFIRELQRELHKRGKLLWLNSFVGQPYFDLGYFEGGGVGSHWGKTWRDEADIELMAKFYQPPGVPVIPLYWHGGDMFKERGSVNEVPYIDQVLAAGLMPTGCYLDPYHILFPAQGGGADWNAIYKYTVAVHHAAYEMRNTAWADIGLQPVWWRDPETNLQIYTLRLADWGRVDVAGRQMPATYLVNVISREIETKDVNLTVDLNRMQFDPGKRLFVWQFLRRDYNKYPKKVPSPENWNELFSRRVCTSSVPGKSPFTYLIPKLEPNRLCVTAITQVPAAIISAAGIPTQTLLPETLGCRLTGAVDEKTKRVTLRVACDKDIEVIAWWPKEWGEARVTVGNAAAEVFPVSFGSEDFVRFGVAHGEWNVSVVPSGHR